MSLDRIADWAPSSRSGVFLLGLLAAGAFGLNGCADYSVDVDGVNTAFLSLGATFPETADQQLGFVDAWRVQVLRPGEGVIAEDAGSVSPDQQTITVEISVSLQASCELLTLVIELSSNGELWFRSEEPEEVCAGTQNGIQTQELQWVGPVIGLSPTGMPFTLEEGGSPRTQTLTVSNQGGGTLNWSASEDQGWLDISPTSGSLGQGQSTGISVTVSDVDLTNGEYQGLVTVSSSNAINSPQTAAVSLTYLQKPRIGLSGTSLSFATEEEVDPAIQTVTITNTGGGTLTWSGSDGAAWLSLAPSSGSLGQGQSQLVQVSVSPGSLAAGAYETSISVVASEASNTPRSIAVGLTVIARPRIGLNPGSLSFSTQRGQNPAAKVLSVKNDGGQTLNWTATVVGASWLGLSTSEGSLASGQAQNVMVSVNAASLNPGTYEASITISAPNALNTPQTVPLTLTVNPDPRIGLSATVLNITMLRGANPAERQVEVSNAGGGVLEWQATDNAVWMGLSPTSGSLGTIGGVGLAQTMTVSINATDLQDGLYQGTITVVDPDADNSPQTIAVNLTIQPRVAPVISKASQFMVNLVKLNDPTCMNLEGSGSRYRVTFNYSDTNGDLPISGGQFVGTPVQVITGFPDYTPIVSSATAEVTGDGFGGRAGLDLCIYYYYNSAVNIWIRLQDEWGLRSNQLYEQHFREEGANSPPQGGGSQGSAAVSPPGSVLIAGGGGS